eukprot:COSAG01_NODE_2811_length_7034_cov_2.875270_3_plen_146_part_00
MFQVRISSGRVGSIRVGDAQGGLTNRSGTSPLAPGTTDTMEVQFGHPGKQPSLNHRHMSPAHDPPDSHLSPGCVVKLKMSTFPWLFRQGGIIRPPCARTAVASEADTARTATDLDLRPIGAVAGVANGPQVKALLRRAATAAGTH